MIENDLGLSYRSVSHNTGMQDALAHLGLDDDSFALHHFDPILGERYPDRGFTRVFEPRTLSL
jgi:hypothetical protein